MKAVSFFYNSVLTCYMVKSMGKRNNRDEEEEHIKKKVKKLKKILEKRRNKESMGSVSDDPPSPLRALELGLPVQDEAQPGPSQIHTEQLTTIGVDLLPEEFSKEEEEIKEVGEAITSKLTLPWTSIMCDGLGKEANGQIIQKDPVPQNFPQAVAPAMKPEILSLLSELTVKQEHYIQLGKSIDKPFKRQH